MKIIAVGDIHGRSQWKIPAFTQDYDLFVFIGDYFDSFELTGEEQIKNFEEILAFKKQFPAKVVLLLGNHDIHYLPEFAYSICKGYQAGVAIAIRTLLQDNKEHLQMAFGIDKFLFTHAGLSETWLMECFETPMLTPTTAPYLAEAINDVWKYQPTYFTFNGIDKYGDDITQTPVWIRPRSLKKDSKTLSQSIIQVVGHTGQDKIDITGKHIFIDTLGTTGEYLVINNNELLIEKTR
jgi:predicted MPP superfamily phosphohydrolase